MKKIKGLLLFGILSLLGISSSFGYENFNRAFGTYTDSIGSKNFYTSFSLANDNVVNNGVGNENGNVLPLGSSFSANQSSYPQETRYIFYESKKINHLFDNLGGNSRKTSWNIGGFVVPGTSPSYSFIINGTGDVLGFNYLHLFYRSSTSLFDDFFFLTSSYLYNMSGSYLDIPGGLSRKKVLPGFNTSYSSISISNGQSEEYFDDFFQFSFVPEDGFQDGGFYNITGIIVLHFNNYVNGYLTGNNSIVLFRDDSNIYYNIFEEYSDSLLTLSSISPISKGVLYSYNGGNGFNDFKSMVFDSGLMLETSGSPSVGLTFKSIDKQFFDLHLYNEYHFTFSENAGVLDWGDFINGGGGGGEDDTPFVFDYNSLLINDMVICYISSGDVCSYANFSMSGFENSFPVVNRLWDGVNGQLLMNSAKPYLTELCLNSDTINYAFCSQLDIYSGAFILFDYSNGILTYNILGDSFAVDVAISNSGQLGSVGCYGAYCTNINVGATEYIINQDSGYYTGLFLSTGYYEDFLTLNKTGFFMRCPYSYENQNVVIGKNLLNKLGGFDILVPINCMIAGFNAGKSFSMIDWAGFKDLGPIMKFTDDYDGNHKILFTFIDVLLSVAIVVILMKFYHLLK